MLRRLLLVPTLALALAAAGCGGGGGGGGNEDGGAMAPEETQTGEVDREITITKQRFGAGWPFTVDEGILRCKGSLGIGAVTFEANGKVYALNALAEDEGHPFADPVLAKDPTGRGKKSLTPILDEARVTVCA